ncbi:NAD(P)-dependent dehydrogenase, short-chain alcohol dehydrogenase family [Nakamurella panacisegetis]|uniref:NAD(P)-dependent dehydrogenase, short-chain alcohol dehydrogenase family n=1 Tax=Nakamurella panacisegetis TaxID=1090615 RepID=A0A1H0N1W2_9ACTN|nr:glucose 1-dehydrogenase [Nakamurella panacisegetis]SDO86360.1 NAD(P)-dependent dehydrogenase, short-chain alcohol dehydrogenase family [Nakamurella panacisegetis]
MTSSPFDLTGQVALVSGANRGLGRAIALELAGAGAAVALGVRRPEAGGELAELIRRDGGRAVVVPMDVTDLTGSRSAIDRAITELGQLDILVNNAGGGINDAAIDVTEEDFDAVWALNTRSTFFLSQHAARHMRPRHTGAIVNIASQAGLVALPGESSYCVSKAAVVHMTKAHAVEWGEYGIRVNAVAPTFIRTDGTGAALSDPAFETDTLERIAALHRIGVPREVSGAVVFLASPAASLITGVTLAIDGGWTAR